MKTIEITDTERMQIVAAIKAANKHLKDIHNHYEGWPTDDERSELKKALQTLSR